MLELADTTVTEDWYQNVHHALQHHQFYLDQDKYTFWNVCRNGEMEVIDWKLSLASNHLFSVLVIFVLCFLPFCLRFGIGLTNLERWLQKESTRNSALTINDPFLMLIESMKLAILATSLYALWPTIAAGKHRLWQRRENCRGESRNWCWPCRLPHIFLERETHGFRVKTWPTDLMGVEPEEGKNVERRVGLENVTIPIPLHTTSLPVNSFPASFLPS